MMRPAPATRPAFDWPIQGRVASGYGSKEDGVSLKGLVLEGLENQEVRSAQDGNVIFVDTGLRGYGKTIIVEHSDGYSTVYARISQILVRTGERVRRGQSIARIGQEGKGNKPQIYFEVRKNSRPLDPQQVLE